MLLLDHHTENWKHNIKLLLLLFSFLTDDLSLLGAQISEIIKCQIVLG